mmetsp:Transcript_35801/g.70981  ORF Transcript_35801/g.70981 Transcript_35801/m.70981 type:complete len:339 (-) Transcript_35801:154-1170(-)
MAFLSSCREVQEDTSSVYEQRSCGPAEEVELDADLKGQDNLLLDGMAQALSAATQTLPKLYGDRWWPNDTKVEEPDGESSKSPEDMHRLGIHVPAEVNTLPDEEMVAERSTAPLGLLNVCLPGKTKRSNGLGAQGCCLGQVLHKSMDVDISWEETQEERLYFERLAAASRLAREEELRQQAEEQERDRLEEERVAARRAARERDRREREKMAAYLKMHGFSGPKAKRKKFFTFWYPLHKAAEENDLEMVQLLLRAGADKSQRNSHGLTPCASATKRNKNSSHEEVLQLLRVGGPSALPTTTSAACRPRVSAAKSKRATHATELSGHALNTASMERTPT